MHIFGTEVVVNAGVGYICRLVNENVMSGVLT